jgi:hypothetical protein
MPHHKRKKGHVSQVIWKTSCFAPLRSFSVGALGRSKSLEVLWIPAGDKLLLLSQKINLFLYLSISSFLTTREGEFVV